MLPPLARVMTQLLDHAEAMVLPWHEVLEPCLNCLNGPGSDSEVPEPWPGWAGQGSRGHQLPGKAPEGYSTASLDGLGHWEGVEEGGQCHLRVPRTEAFSLRLNFRFWVWEEPTFPSSCSPCSPPLQEGVPRGARLRHLSWPLPAGARDRLVLAGGSLGSCAQAVPLTPGSSPLLSVPACLWYSALKFSEISATAPPHLRPPLSLPFASLC